MNDISNLASQATQFLAPFVPYLVKGGIEVAKGAASKVSELTAEEGWEMVKSLWGKLTKYEEVKKAAEIVARLPDDADALAVLRLQIKLALATDSTLVEELVKFLSEATKQSIIITDAHSVAIGGDVQGNIIITGDHNEVERFAGDSTTDAPPPETKRKKKSKGR